MSTIAKSSSFALAAAAAAMLAGCGTMAGNDSMESSMAAVEGKCHGVNTCKGQSGCATAKSACAGQNACKGQGWTKALQEDCETKGGRFES